uniref:coiled-coil domain-containing protein 18-like isoform X2 n=1 Tax=Styela clava TaxID=7725 RepID=UPI00193966C8|nr:coiled-coil domain-containing protein 18-like isoform X2 [Styela clava]
MSTEASDDDILKNVFQLRERLMRTENSLQKINKLAEMDGTEADTGVKLSFSEPYFHLEPNDSVNLPPPLTLDDLGELTTHDETDYSPVNESVLRQWNMNNETKIESQHSKALSRARSPSPEHILRVSQGSHRSNETSQHSFKRNLKKQFSPRKLMGPSTSSPNLARYGRHATRAYSCDDLTSATDMREIYVADSYRMLKKPSVNSDFSVSAPISPRKSRSTSSHNRNSSTQANDLYHNSGLFEPIQGITADSSISALANYTLTTPRKSPRNNESADSTLLEQTKENITPNRPISARSNATSVTMLGAEAESERLQSRLSMLREDNERLHSLVSDLRRQLEIDQSRKSGNDIRMIEKMREQILSLKEEAEASEKALRRAEESLERSEMVCQNKIDDVISLKDEISHLKSLLTESEMTKESATKNYKEAYQDAQSLASQVGNLEQKLSNVKKENDRETTQLQQQISGLEKFKSEIAEKAAKLQHTNSQLQSDLRNALLQIESKETKVNERDTEKLHISRALQDLQSRFADLRSNLKKKENDFEAADNERNSLRKQLDTFVQTNHLQQDRLSSCQHELEEYRNQITKLENELRKSKHEKYHGGPVDSGRGASVTFSDRLTPTNDLDNCHCETSPRKQKAIIAEMKMKLAAKEAQIQRLEARVNNFSMEAEKLEGIRGELINVVERSRLGDKRAHELEDIVHKLEDERSKITRQLMECEDHLNDKKSECESLESRLNERTRNLTKLQSENDEHQKRISKFESDSKNNATRIYDLERELGNKTQECESRYTALQRAEEEIAEKKRALDNAAEWTGKREAESRREMEKMKKIHKEQHEEMEAQIEKLLSDSNRYREQARELECVSCQLRDENEIVSKRLKAVTCELQEIKNQDEIEKKNDKEALETLERKAKESSEQVVSLQSALSQCKLEIRNYVDQLEETSSKFQHQMNVKNSQVLKYESELKITRESLQSENLHVQALEVNLTERQKMLQQASDRISELEDCQSCMQSKIGKLEQQLNRVTMRSNQDREQWEGKIQSACRELEAKNQQFTQLNDALKEVDKEFSSCRKELISVEQQLQKLRADSNDKSKQLEKVKEELSETKAQLSGKTHQISNLDELLKESESQKKELEGNFSSQQSELLRLRNERQTLSHHSTQLQSALQAKDIDVLKKETFVARLQSALKETKENLSKKERDVEDLERALEDRQWELQQRAAQLGQLEVSVKEHKSIAEKRQIELQAEARKAQVELKQRNSQVGTLDEQLSNLRSELSEERHQLEEKEQELRRVNRETEQRDERIKDLEKALEESRTAYEERHRACLEVTQELRVAREQSQKSSQQWQDAQRELTRLQHQQENLFGDLESLGKTDKEKENHLSELSGKLAASQVEKSAIEGRYASELDRLRNDVLKMHQQHQEEIARLRNEHTQQLTKAKIKAGGRSEDLRNAIEKEKEANEECESMRDVVLSLERELLARKQVIEAANDTIVVKEAEIARLEAKLAGIERGKRMQDFSSPEKLQQAVNEADEQPDFLPSFLAPDAMDDAQLKTLWRSPEENIKTRQQPAHGSSTLFSGLDPDSSSLSPSFIHIAASTKRPNTVDDALARVLANSPSKELDASTNMEESLFARVFDNTRAADSENRLTQRHSDARMSRGTSRSVSDNNQFGFGSELKPDQCMADLQERLRASEQRRQEVTSKLRQLKTNAKS